MSPRVNSKAFGSAPTFGKTFKGVWFCADLWENRELTWTEKALLAEIDSLSGRGQACFAGNEHLAERLNVKPTHMREMLAKLTDLGYLVRLAFDGRRTLRCVNPEVSSNPTASRHLMEAHQVPESSYRIKPKAQGKYRLKPRSGIGQNRDLESVLTYTEISSRETQKGNDDDPARAQAKAMPLPPTKSIVVVSSGVTEEKKEAAVLAPRPDPEHVQLTPLAQEFGLSVPQADSLTRYVERKGLDYVREKAAIVRAQGSANAGRALMAALKGDWQKPKALAKPRPAKKAPAEPLGWQEYVYRRWPNAERFERFAQLPADVQREAWAQTLERQAAC